MVKAGWPRTVACAVLLPLAVAGHAAEVDVGALPRFAEKPGVTRFESMKAPWRDYFLSARQAVQLPNRLEQCLAFPDLPDTKWPQGYGAAHCHYHWGQVPTAADIKAYLDRNDVAGLEANLVRLFSKHDTPGPEQESTHAFFHQFTELDEASFAEIDALTERWTRLAPESALAATARASYLRGRGWSARGAKFSRHTPREQMDAMSTWFDRAEAEYRRAIRLAPESIDPYIGLVNIGKADRDDVGEWAFKKANAIDPGCADLVYNRMTGLMPRWGGSHRAMEAYMADFAPHVATRPLLANQLSTLYFDYVSVMEHEQKYTPEAAGIVDAAVTRSGLEESLHLAADVALNIKEHADPTRAAALLLQESRFNAIIPWGSRQIGRRLVRDDPAWALAVMQPAVLAEPDNAYGRYLLAAAHYNSGNYKDAERHYLVAAEHADHREDSLRELASMWLLDAGLPQAEAARTAKPYIDRLLEVSPDNGRGLLLRIHATVFAEKSFPMDVVNRFLEVADANDPVQARARDQLQKMMEAKPKGAAQ